MSNGIDILFGTAGRLNRQLLAIASSTGIFCLLDFLTTIGIIAANNMIREAIRFISDVFISFTCIVSAI
jgi:hypothetical protein